MATRDTFSSGSAGPVIGPDYMDQIAAHVKRLYDAAQFPLTSVAGTANAVTASLDPVLDVGGLVSGMRFGITWAATNTAAMTLAINGASPVAILDGAGAALVAGAAQSGKRALLEYVSGAFRIVAAGADGAGAAGPYYLQVTTSQTWTKPTGYADDTPVWIECWGAGGGGGAGTQANGGTGGAFKGRLMRYADIPTSVTISIGGGGAAAPSTAGTPGSAGGTTSFGALLIAGGGAGGIASGTNLAATAGSDGYSRDGGAAGATGVGTTPATAGQAPGGGGGKGLSSAAAGAGARGEARIWIG